MHNYIFRTFVQEHCWLVNLTGTFCPIDRAQELNIKDMKVTYCSQGPSINWLFMKKPHPIIPVIKGLSDHVEQEFGTISRGKKHTVPKKDKDVKTLQAAFSNVDTVKSYHEYVQG